MIDDKKEIFVMFARVIHNKIKNLNNVHIERKIQIDSVFAKIENKSNIKIIIFEILKEFADLTNENKIYELFDHESNDHAKNLKFDKKFLYNFIYSLLENQFKILRTYLNKHFKNDFIRLFIFSTDVSILFVKKKTKR